MKKESFFERDIAIIILSILVAVILVQTGVLTKILDATQGVEFLGSFIAGMFFTSVFTTAPAIAVLGEIARVNNLPMVALTGALGAVLGDMLIFKFFRDRFSTHLMELIKHQGGGKRIQALFRLRSFHWLTFFIGGLIIASPLPDELGIALLGFSKIKMRLFIPLSFTFNFLGILLIGTIARSL